MQGPGGGSQNICVFHMFCMSAHRSAHMSTHKSMHMPASVSIHFPTHVSICVPINVSIRNSMRGSTSPWFDALVHTHVFTRFGEQQKENWMDEARQDMRHDIPRVEAAKRHSALEGLQATRRASFLACASSRTEKKERDVIARCLPQN